MLELVQLTTSRLTANETVFATTAGRKTFLPKRAGEPRFAPRQYYYAASKRGVVPSIPMRAVSNVDEGSDIQRDAA
jgi:hypothetical protein